LIQRVRAIRWSYSSSEKSLICRKCFGAMAGDGRPPRCDSA
jgi:hypothetical protein